MFINESANRRRIRFTLAHALGHIVLGHLSDERTEIDRGGISGLLHNQYEGGADIFAGNRLVPPIIIKEVVSDLIEKRKSPPNLAVKMYWLAG